MKVKVKMLICRLNLPTLKRTLVTTKVQTLFLRAVDVDSKDQVSLRIIKDYGSQPKQTRCIKFF